MNYISETDYEKISRRSGVDDGDVLYAMIGTIGNPVVVKKDREFGIKNLALFKLKDNTNILNHYLKIILESDFAETNLVGKKRGVTQNFVSLTDIRDFCIPVPELSIQKRIFEKIEAEQKLIEANKQLIEIFTKKMKATVNSIWGR